MSFYSHGVDVALDEPTVANFCAAMREKVKPGATSHFFVFYCWLEHIERELGSRALKSWPEMDLFSMVGCDMGDEEIELARCVRTGLLSPTHALEVADTHTLERLRCTNFTGTVLDFGKQASSDSIDGYGNGWGLGRCCLWWEPLHYANPGVGFPSLREVNFSFYEISENGNTGEGADGIIEALASLGMQIHALNLNSVEFQGRGLHDVTNTLMPLMRNLRSLNLRYTTNCCGGRSLDGLCRYLPNLIALNISSNSSLTQTFYRELAQLPELTILDMASLRVPSHLVPELSQCLSQLSSLVSLNVSRLMVNGALGDTIAPAIGSLTNLKYLSVSANKWGDQFPALAQSLSQLIQLVSLSILDCGLTAEHVPFLAGAVQCMPSLDTLHISANPLGTEGVGIICPVLAQLPAFRQLHLAETALNADSIRVIGQAFSQSTTLQFLNLSENALQGNPLGPLSAIRSLRFLNVAYNMLSEIPMAVVYLPALYSINAKKNGYGFQEPHGLFGTRLPPPVETLVKPPASACNRGLRLMRRSYATMRKLARRRSLTMRCTPKGPPESQASDFWVNTPERIARSVLSFV